MTISTFHCQQNCLTSPHSVNEVFNPEHVDDIYAQDPKIRAQEISHDKATNYGVVRMELLEQIYEEMYMQQMQHPSEEDRPLRIMNHRELKGMRDVTVDGKAAVELQIQNNSNAYSAHKSDSNETWTVDLVIVASGYRRDAHLEMLRNVRNLMPGGDEADKTFSVRRDYGVEFAQGAVQKDAGVWLQGCNEATHGLSDSLLSILSVRGGEMVDSIFGYSAKAQSKQVETSLEMR